MEIQDIRSKNEKEIRKNLAEMRNRLTKMKFDISSKQTKNHREVRKIKKSIARLMSVLKEKESSGKP